MKKFTAAFLCLIMVMGLFPATALAEPEWPSGVSIEAEGGIVMDADTGTVLYSKNEHNHYFPASITKILTALIVIENCSLDETVTFSHNAVYNVEANSSSAGMDVGDELSVKDCLYALLLKSANEVANALAEHVSGTTEQFAELMNQKAASLGCVDSHFANPSGLNDPNHYTSAHDMALIAQAAYKNATFMKIDSSLYYDLPVTKRNPDGARVYPGNKMIKKNTSEYYPGAFAGKTGYTTLAGNTLVTYAKRDGMTLITVILNGHQTHYSDTKKMLDFGFQNFHSVLASDYDTTYTSVDNDMTIAGLTASDLTGLVLDKTSKITLPKNTDFSNVSSALSYDLNKDDPPDALAKVLYTLGDRSIGSTYVELKTADASVPDVPPTTMEDITGITPESTAAPAKEPVVKKKPVHIPSIIWVILAVIIALAAIITATVFIKNRINRKEARERNRRRMRRNQRLQDIGYSAVEFDLLMEQKRTTLKPKSGKRHRNRRYPFFK